MENSVDNKKAEISFLLKELKKLISKHSDEVSEYLKDEYYFQDTEDKIDDKKKISFSKLKYEYYDLAVEFRNFVLQYNISNDEIKESIVDNRKTDPKYILHERPIGDKKEGKMDDEESIDSDDDDNEEKMDENKIIDNEETMGKNETIDNEETTDSDLGKETTKNQQLTV